MNGLEELYKWFGAKHVDKLVYLQNHLNNEPGDVIYYNGIVEVTISWLTTHTDKTPEGLAYELENIRKRKNNDYGNSFEILNNQFGSLAGLIRIHDKINRIKSLSERQQQVLDESLVDTYMDLTNYVLMQIDWINKQEEEEHGKEN